MEGPHARIERTGGLGRGLDAIIPVPPEPRRVADAPVSRVDEVLQGLVEVGLDALQAAVADLDLCAYLHAADGQGPQLHLRRPTLDTMTATEAFELFAALGALLQEGGTDGPGPVGRFHGLAVGTAGDRSKGLHAVGRLGIPLDEAELATAGRLCRAIGKACHHLDAGARPEDEPPFPTRVAVQMSGGLAGAEVTLATGGRLQTTRAEGHTPLAAVANAVVRALGDQVVVAEAQRLTVGGRETVVVLVQSPAGRAGVGSALSDPDELHAAAVATLGALAAVDRRP